MPRNEKSLGPVTDPVVLKKIAHLGWNSSDVDFIEDYGPRVKGKSSPYMKRYFNHKNKMYMACFSCLPMVNHAGKRVSCMWRNTGPFQYMSEDNQFIASVVGTSIEVETINEQSSGSMPGDIVSWNPQIFVGGIEILVSGNSKVLAVDPVNSNYVHNVVEWNYGPSIKRRLRLIEGKLLERWEVMVNPGTDIRIRHNTIGKDLRLGLAVDARGRPVPVMVIGDEEIIASKDLANVIFPVTIGASLTFYPDDTVAVDGWTYGIAGAPAGMNWDAAHDHAGTAALDNDAVDVFIQSGQTNLAWYNLSRGIILFDTSALTTKAILSSATLYLYGKTVLEEWDINMAINVYSSNPISDTGLVGGDHLHTRFGVSKYSDTDILIDNFTLDYNNNFQFNATGLSAISKTGNTKLSLRMTADVADAAPVWFAGISTNEMAAYSSDQGAGFKPKLVVLYTMLPDGGTSVAHAMAAGDLM